MAQSNNHINEQTIIAKVAGSLSFVAQATKPPNKHIATVVIDFAKGVFILLLLCAKTQKAPESRLDGESQSQTRALRFNF